MKRKSKYFLGLLILIIGLFVITAASVIYCILNGSSVAEEQTTEHIMAMVYMFLHLAVVAIFSFFAFKAYYIKSVLVSVFMTSEDGSKNIKARNRAIVLASIFGVLAIYFLILCFGADIFLSFFSLGLKFALMNFFLSIASISLYLVFYKPIETIKSAE